MRLEDSSGTRQHVDARMSARRPRWKRFTVDRPQRETHRVHNLDASVAYTLSHSCTKHACGLGPRLPPIRTTTTRSSRLCVVTDMRRDAGCILHPLAHVTLRRHLTTVPLHAIRKYIDYINICIYIYLFIYVRVYAFIIYLLFLCLNEIRIRFPCIKQIYIYILRLLKEEKDNWFYNNLYDNIKFYSIFFITVKSRLQYSNIYHRVVCILFNLSL